MSHVTAIADAMRTASALVANRSAARQADSAAAAARRDEAEREAALDAERRTAHVAEVAAVHEAEAALRRIPEDELLRSVADDPDLAEAERQRDPDLPATLRFWLAARITALLRAGVAEQEICPLYSLEIESILAPFVVSRGAFYDHQRAVLITEDAELIAKLRRDMSRMYGDLAEVAVQTMLKNCRLYGANLNALRAAAGLERNGHDRK
jgi:hypothetical protein